MTDQENLRQNITGIVDRVTARLDAVRILRAYARQIAAVIDQQEGLAREEAMSMFGDNGEALFRSIRDIHYDTAESGNLPDMNSILAIPGMASLIAPPWADLARREPRAPVATYEEPVDDGTSPTGDEPEAHAPPDAPAEALPPAPFASVDPPAELPVVPPGAGAGDVTVLYGIEIEAGNVPAAHNIVDEARRAVASGIPEAFFAYKKRVGRHQWRRTLYEQVFRDEAAEAGVPVPEAEGGAPVAALQRTSPAEPLQQHVDDQPIEEVAQEEDMVFGDVDGAQDLDDEVGVPSFLAEAEVAPASNGSTDAFGEPVQEPVGSWLRPFDESGDGAPQAEPVEEKRVVPFAPPRPVRMAPGLRRPS